MLRGVGWTRRRQLSALGLIRSRAPELALCSTEHHAGLVRSSCKQMKPVSPRGESLCAPRRHVGCQAGRQVRHPSSYSCVLDFLTLKRKQAGAAFVPPGRASAHSPGPGTPAKSERGSRPERAPRDNGSLSASPSRPRVEDKMSPRGATGCRAGVIMDCTGQLTTFPRGPGHSPCPGRAGASPWATRITPESPVKSVGSQAALPKGQDGPPRPGRPRCGGAPPSGAPPAPLGCLSVSS